MVTGLSRDLPRHRRRAPHPGAAYGFLTMELVVVLAILFMAVIPLAYSFVAEARLLRVGYERAVAMELVDGEMEILVAGEWRAFAPGTHDYPLRGAAATNLPPGRCQLTITTGSIRLEWRPDQRRGVGAVVREVKR